MQRRQKIRFEIFIYTILCLGLFSSGCTEKKQTTSIICIPDNLLQEGDLAFRRGYGMESDIVVALDKVGVYSHLGIIVKDTLKGWQIIHTVPGEATRAGEPDRIKMDDLSLFFRGDRASCGAIMRLEGETEKCKNASLQALQLYHRGVLFDHSYDLKDTTNMYCTELIDFVFRKENICLYKDTIDKKYLLPGDIQTNKNLEVIFRF